jgi:hypothetical protein
MLWTCFMYEIGGSHGSEDVSVGLLGVTTQKTNVDIFCIIYQ